MGVYICRDVMNSKINPKVLLFAGGFGHACGERDRLGEGHPKTCRQAEWKRSLCKSCQSTLLNWKPEYFGGMEVLKKVFKIMLETWFSSSFRKTWLWMGWEIWVYFIFSFYFFFLPENIQILFLMKMVKIKYKDPVPLLTASSLFCYYSMTAFSSLNIFFLRGPHY